MTFFCGRFILFFLPIQRIWSMAFGIFFSQLYLTVCRFLFHVIHDGCVLGFFFFPRVFFLSSHRMTARQGKQTLTPRVCVSVDRRQDAVTCLLYPFFKARSAWVPPRCCHLETRSRNTRTSSTLPRSQWCSCDTRYISCLKSPSLHRCCFFFSRTTFTLLMSVSSVEDFRNIGWDSFTKCTLYVFQSL